MMILLVSISIQLFGQDTVFIKNLNKLEFLLSKQISSAAELKVEEKKLVDRIDKLIEVYDSVSIQNIVKNEELDNKVSSNAANIDLINNKKTEKKQNSWTDIIKAISALFTAFVALPAALLSIYNFHSQKIKRLNELEEYYNVVINGLYKPIEDQASSLLALSKNLNDINIEEAKLKNEPSLNFENIKNIDNSDLYKIFVSNRNGDKMNKLKNFGELERAINRIKFIKSNLMTNYKNCIQQNNSYRTSWNQNWSEILKYRRNSIEETVKNQNNNDEFLKNIGQLHEGLRNVKDNHKLKTRQLKFIVPLHKLCEDYFTNDPKAGHILSFTIECNSAFNGIETTSKRYKELFEKNRDDLLEDKNTIKESLEYLLSIERLCKLRLLFS